METHVCFTLPWNKYMVTESSLNWFYFLSCINHSKVTLKSSRISHHNNKSTSIYWVAVINISLPLSHLILVTTLWDKYSNPCFFHMKKLRLSKVKPLYQGLTVHNWQPILNPYFDSKACVCIFNPYSVFLFVFNLFLFLAALGLLCCMQAFSSCGERGLLFIVVRGLLIALASLVAEHGL